MKRWVTMATEETGPEHRQYKTKYYQNKSSWTKTGESWQVL